MQKNNPQTKQPEDCVLKFIYVTKQTNTYKLYKHGEYFSTKTSLKYRNSYP
jgi:hypothetical protein